MRYMRSYKFVFENPKWPINILWLCLCALSGLVIPVIGQIIMVGYLFEIIEFMHRRGDDSRYPDFTLDRFAQYLMRGLWVFLVQLIVLLPLILVLGVFYGALIAMLVVIKGEVGTAFLVLMAVFFVVLLVAGILMALLTFPLGLRAGLGQDFMAAFSMAFIKDFVGKMWKEEVLVTLFLAVTAIPLGLIGLLMCLIGIYPVAALMQFAQAHLNYQLYELYLERGGMPIRLKQDDEMLLEADSERL